MNFMKGYKLLWLVNEDGSQLMYCYSAFLRRTLLLFNVYCAGSDAIDFSLKHRANLDEFDHKLFHF